MPGIWLPMRPNDPQEQMDLDHLLASVVRYGVAAKLCPLCGNSGLLSIGHLGEKRNHSKFECGTEVGLGTVVRGEDCHWECKV